MYLLQVGYGQQLLQPGQKFRHQLLQFLIIVRAVVCRKHLLQKQPEVIWVQVINTSLLEMFGGDLLEISVSHSKTHLEK